MKKHNIILTIAFIIIISVNLILLPITVEGRGGVLPQTPPDHDIKIVPTTDTGYEDLAYLLASKPRLLAFIDFRTVRNESLPQIFSRTSYSANINMPSSNVYVKNGELYINNVNHLIIEEKAFRTIGIKNIDLSNNILVAVYVRIVSGKSYRYARAGIGFYGKTEYLSSRGYYAGTGYWLSVLGSFNGRKLSYDFEGHWSKLNDRWFSSATYRKFIFNYNRTYILWIARVGDYLVGGIIDGSSGRISSRDLVLSIKSYIKEDNVYKIDLTAYKMKIAIERIEIYNLEPMRNPQNNTIKLVEPVIYSSRFALLQPRKNTIIEYIFHRQNNIIELKAIIKQTSN